MHIIESYATSCGAKISKPYIYEKFFPIAIDKYITLQTVSAPESKKYDYWQEVVDLILPALSSRGIGIVQVGDQNDNPLVGCYLTMGQASPNQVAYILSHSKLHLSVDDLTMDIASRNGTKTVTLFSNSLPSQSGPYWTDDSDHTSLMSDLKGDKPSYSRDESPKSINTIMPSVVAEAVCDQLEVEIDIQYNYEYIGAAYPFGMMNIVPDVPITQYGIKPPPNISVRMDYNFNEQGLAENLSVMRCNVVTDRPINPNLLIQLKQNINQLIYLITDDNEPNFAKFLMNNAIEYLLVSQLPEEKIQKHKRNYMDYGVIVHRGQLSRDKIDTDNKLKDKKLFFKSNKFILSKGKIFHDKASWQRDLPANTLEKRISPVLDCNEFWDDFDNYCILTKKDG